MNKKDFNSNLSYFFKAFLIAFIPIMIIVVLLEKFKVNEIIIWLITFILIGTTLLIALLIKLRKNNNKEKKKEDKFDPYSD